MRYKRGKKMEYDYLIVGSGLFGSVFAHEATQNGKKCLVIDKRNHIGGNLYTEVIDNIVVHKYGAHIFHTDDKYIWDYINKFGRFNNYINSPLANYNGEIYNLPFNMNTFFQLWKTNDVEQVKSNIKKEIESFGIKKISNLEDQAISMIGTTLYYKLVKGYTEKQWGKNCKELPASIIKRLPLRFTYDNNYFNDRFQGVPIDGYTPIIEKMLAGSDLKLNTDYFDFIKKNQNIAKKIIYTGAIDEYYNYCYGELEYRSLYFDHKNIKCSNFVENVADCTTKCYHKSSLLYKTSFR